MSESPRQTIDRALEVLHRRIEHGEWTSADRALYDHLGKMPHELLDKWDSPDVDTLDAIWLKLAKAVLQYEKAPHFCEDHGTRYGLVPECASCELDEEEYLRDS